MGTCLTKSAASRDFFSLPSDTSPNHFTGQQHDYDSGDDYFGARHYSPAIGRFMSVDPGGAGADPEGPQSWNAYAYVEGDPINSTDPTGLQGCRTEGTADTTVCVFADFDTYDTVKSVLSDLLNGVGDVAQRTQTYIQTAWDWYRTSRVDPGRVAGWTLTGAAFGASKGPAIGFTLGLAGGPAAEITAPGGAALGMAAGGVAGGGIGYAWQRRLPY